MFKKILITSSLTITIILMTVAGNGYNDVSLVSSVGEGDMWVVPKNIDVPNVSLVSSVGEGDMWVVPKNIDVPNVSLVSSVGEGDMWVVPKNIEISKGNA